MTIVVSKVDKICTNLIQIVIYFFIFKCNYKQQNKR